MAVSVKHSATATLPDEPGAEINKAEWNADHTVVGLGTAAEAATTDFEVAGAVAAHAAAADPHTGYQKESEKDAASGYAGLSAATKIAGAQQTYGSAANTACVGNDARLSDARVPPDGDKGDITVASGGTAWTIDAGAVTLAKMADLAQDKFIIRTTASTGVPETATCTAAGRALIDDADAATQRATLSLNNVTNDAQTKAAVVPNTAPSAGQLLVGNAGGTAYAPVSSSGDVTVSSAGAFTIGAAKVTRAMLAADAKNWQFLGQATASGAVRTGTITWTGTFKQLWFEYFISGYSNTAIARLIVGPTAGLSETATNHCCSLIEGVTLNATSVSIPGWPTAVTVNNVERYGSMYVKNVAGAVKRMWGQGNHAGTAATVVPLQMQFAGLMSDATNAINKAELAVYDAITGATISTRTLNAGTYLNVWGRNDD
jgi:hypothetical protein